MKEKNIIKKIEKKVSGIGKATTKLIAGKKILGKPKAKAPSVSPKKFITQGLGKPTLVKEGRTGYFKEEYIKEKQSWLN